MKLVYEMNDKERKEYIRNKATRKVLNKIKYKQELRRVK
jgi:hypothetical protein